MVSETWQRKPADTEWWWAYPEINHCCMQSINTVCVSLMSDVSMGGEPQGSKLLKMKPELESETAVRQMFFKLSDSSTLCLNIHRPSSLTPECWNPLTLFNCEWTLKNRMDVKKKRRRRRRVCTRNMQHKGLRKSIIVYVTRCMHMCLCGFGNFTPVTSHKEYFIWEDVTQLSRL